MKQDFELTQEEMDALVLLQRMPYRVEDEAMVCKAGLFIHLYEEQTGREVESKRMEDLLLDCLFERDYKQADIHLPECRRVLEDLFERTEFAPVEEAHA